MRPMVQKGLKDWMMMNHVNLPMTLLVFRSVYLRGKSHSLYVNIIRFGTLCACA